MSNEAVATMSKHASARYAQQPTILVVDDEPTTVFLLKKSLLSQGYQVLEAENGEVALNVLKESGADISAVIMDLNMPVLNGFEVVKTMKNHDEMAYIPVIMTTAAEGPEVVREGIEAGVYYCLHKPLDPALLHTLVGAAVREFDMTKDRQNALASQRNALQMMNTARFSCCTLRDVEVLSQLLASAFPDPKRTIIGINELLINAIEHGNLGIRYEEKTQLVTAGTWRETVNKLQQQGEYASKKVDVVLQRKSDGVYLQISDEGEGFDWWRYLEIDPARAMHPNGRGIALANKISFDRLQFTHNGSRVLAVVEVAESGVENSKKAASLKW
jgi:CheY-like chemotaxis protein